MVQGHLDHQAVVGLVQAAIAGLAALLVVVFARTQRIHLEKDASIALVRGLVQIIAVGSVLAVLLRGPRWTSGLMLAAMIVAAGIFPPGGRRKCRERLRFRPGRLLAVRDR